ncbi:hypothetical protein YC2023_068539 [Brassica napus]
MKLIVPWIVVILLNSYFLSLHPWGQVAAAGFQSDFGVSRKFAYLSTISYIVALITIIALVRLEVGDVNVGRHMKILCDWCYHKSSHFMGLRVLIHIPPNPPLHEFGIVRRLLFFFDDYAFAWKIWCSLGKYAYFNQNFIRRAYFLLN